MVYIFVWGSVATPTADMQMRSYASAPLSDGEIKFHHNLRRGVCVCAAGTSDCVLFCGQRNYEMTTLRVINRSVRCV